MDKLPEYTLPTCSHTQVILRLRSRARARVRVRVRGSAMLAARVRAIIESM